MRAEGLSFARAALLAAAAVLAVFGPGWALGRSLYWGDLTYIHHPWRALAAEEIQAGRLPLWNPFLYFGMPFSANIQSAVFYPASILYYLFGFATATAIFQAVHYWLAALLMHLWLRRAFPGWAAFSGALVYGLGGGLMSRAPFINHLSVLALMPALFLFFNRPLILALALSCGFLAGYPPFLIGGAAGAWAFWWLWRARTVREVRAAAGGWALAAALAAVLSACVLVPAAELAALCRRTTAGMELAETLRFGYAPGDLLRWISPALVSWRAFDPATEWWTCAYLGFAASAAAVVGFWTLGRRRQALLAAWLAAVALLILGDSNAVSRALWAHAAPLRFIRYPGNLFYLALAPLSLLAAAGAARLRRPAWLAAAIAVELIFYGGAKLAWTERALFTQAGPLVHWLQTRAGAERYLLSPRALEAHRGADAADWKTRLYGLTNAPYHLRAAGNFGEPLVPRASYDFMDALYSAPSASDAAALFPWAGVRYLLTPGELPLSPGLAPEGKTLWSIYRFRGQAALAWGLDEAAGRELSADLPSGPLRATPLEMSSARPDRLAIALGGNAPAWVYAAQPRYPDWEAWARVPGGWKRLESEPAALAFCKFHLPPGALELELLYRPASFARGLVLTLAGLFAAAALGARRRRA